MPSRRMTLRVSISSPAGSTSRSSTTCAVLSVWAITRAKDADLIDVTTAANLPALPFGAVHDRVAEAGRRSLPHPLDRAVVDLAKATGFECEHESDVYGDHLQEIARLVWPTARETQR